jgi:hypothetical protein
MLGHLDPMIRNLGIHFLSALSNLTKGFLKIDPTMLPKLVRERFDRPMCWLETLLRSLLRRR